MTNRLLYYIKVWLMLAKNSYVTWISKRGLFLIFLTGKILRYAFYFSFLYFLVNASRGILNYTNGEVLFFTATFVTIDTISQFLFRSVYTFRPLVVSGDFDMTLLKPMNPLFRALAGGPDPMDLITLPPIIYITYLIGRSLDPSSAQIIMYSILCLNGILIAMAFHILVLALGIITLEIDHTIMVFRDLSSMGRFPVDIYKEPLRSILTFVVPVGLMVTVPAKTLMGEAAPHVVIFTLIFGLVFLYSSLKFWNYALKKYTSASS